jgi:hypothetical protein
MGGEYCSYGNLLRYRYRINRESSVFGGKLAEGSGIDVPGQEARYRIGIGRRELGKDVSKVVIRLETTKANGHEPYRYLAYLFDHLPLCKTTAEREALLPYRLLPSTYVEN